MEKKRKLMDYLNRGKTGTPAKTSNDLSLSGELHSGLTAADCNPKGQILVASDSGAVLLANFKYYTPKYCDPLTSSLTPSSNSLLARSV